MCNEPPCHIEEVPVALTIRLLVEAPASSENRCWLQHCLKQALLTVAANMELAKGWPWVTADCRPVVSEFVVADLSHPEWDTTHRLCQFLAGQSDQNEVVVFDGMRHFWSHLPAVAMSIAQRFLAVERLLENAQPTMIMAIYDDENNCVWRPRSPSRRPIVRRPAVV